MPSKKRAKKAPAGARVLAVDDQPQVTELITEICSERGFQVTPAHKPSEAMKALKGKEPFDLVVLDYNLGRGKKNGLQVLEDIRKINQEVPIVFLSGEGTIEIAVKAMKLGAIDFIEKDDMDIQMDLALDKVTKLLATLQENRELKEENAKLKSQNDVYKQELYRKYQIVGVSEAMKKLCALVERVAPIPRPVLVLGERGSGKELVAQAIHRASPRKGAPFVTINCAAFAEGLLECELFGQEENAFTNAPFRRGRFELADGGTLFMDEVANMPLEFQQTVLRVLEYQSFQRVGGGKTLNVDVRVVAATNADLNKERKEGKFRDDLYDRLAFEVIRMPPLRERKEDIAPLAYHFLSLISLEVPDIKPQTIDDSAIEKLQEYEWPGNIRELKYYVERAAYRCDAEVISINELPPLDPGA